MVDIISSWDWFLVQPLSVQVLVATGSINIVIAGLKQMGLTQAADFCQKLENSFLAMTAAAKGAFVTSFQTPIVPKI